MKALGQKLGLTLAGLVLAAGPALAQRPEPGAGSSDRGAGAATSSGGGGAMGGGGGGGGGNIASSGGSSSSSSGGGGDFSSPSASSFSSPTFSSGDRGFRTTAPEHRVSYSGTSQRTHTASSGDQAAPRSASAGGERVSPRSEAGGGERAAPRGGVARGNGADIRMNEGGAPANNPGGAREVPTWSRPRGDRPVTDVATTRVGPTPPRDSGDRNNPGRYINNDPYYYYPNYYSTPYGWYDYWTFGSYYSCYSAFYSTPCYSPFGFGWGIPFGYYDPFYADPGDYGGGYGSYSNKVYGGHDQGSLKLKVKPANAKVYVDGYYVGLVDQFNSSFQKLTLNSGRHKVEVRADGYETAEFDVLITPEQTVTFQGEMKKVQ